MSFFGDILSRLNPEGLAQKLGADKMMSGLDFDGLLGKIKSASGTVGLETTRLALQLFYVLKAPTTKVMDKVIIGAALAYQFMPDLMPRDKFGPLLSMVDNAITLAVAYNRVKHNVTPEINAQVDEKLEQWFGKKQSETSIEASAAPAAEPVAPAEAPAPTASTESVGTVISIKNIH